MPLYFAYGSNLLTARLLARCPTAKPVSIARLAGYRAAIAKRSKVDGSGKATILVAKDRVTSGTVYALAADDLQSLDSIEGVGHGYDRITRTLSTPQGNLDAVTYIATAPEEQLVPFDWYLALIIAGAQQHSLPPEDHASLLAGSYRVDTTLDRPARLAAISALTLSGLRHWHNLLPPLSRS